MDSAFKTLKNIVLILLVVYIISFLIYTDFLINLAKTNPKFDFSRYLFKILNLE
ncbi:MAG: hypothetical protein KatS3mg096_159 [Candidatus Parcubacteria bacterium]|nr:MAG: hypothetical protein KatS3mg096_159 [Candidatus Parcubacteria bacterium]